MKKIAGAIFLATLLSTCLMVRTGSAERVKTYEDLLALLSNESSPEHQTKLLEIINKSQKAMIDQYSKQNVISSSVSRYFKFKDPIAIHYISDQYFAVSFPERFKTPLPASTERPLLSPGSKMRKMRRQNKETFNQRCGKGNYYRARDR